MVGESVNMHECSGNRKNVGTLDENDGPKEQQDEPGSQMGPHGGLDKELCGGENDLGPQDGLGNNADVREKETHIGPQVNSNSDDGGNNNGTSNGPQKQKQKQKQDIPGSQLWRSVFTNAATYAELGPEFSSQLFNNTGKKVKIGQGKRGRPKTKANKANNNKPSSSTPKDSNPRRRGGPAASSRPKYVFTKERVDGCEASGGEDSEDEDYIQPQVETEDEDLDASEKNESSEIDEDEEDASDYWSNLNEDEIPGGHLEDDSGDEGESGTWNKRRRDDLFEGLYGKVQEGPFHEGFQFETGQTFVDVYAFRKALKDYCIKYGYVIGQIHNDLTRYTGQCTGDEGNC